MSSFNKACFIRNPELRRQIDAEKRALWEMEKEIASNSGMPSNLYDEYRDPIEKEFIHGSGGKWRVRPCDTEDNPLCIEELEYGKDISQD